jgi:hypothetical protein
MLGLLSIDEPREDREDGPLPLIDSVSLDHENARDARVGCRASSYGDSGGVTSPIGMRWSTSLCERLSLRIASFSSIVAVEGGAVVSPRHCVERRKVGTHGSNVAFTECAAPGERRSWRGVACGECWLPFTAVHRLLATNRTRSIRRAEFHQSKDTIITRQTKHIWRSEQVAEQEQETCSEFPPSGEPTGHFVPECETRVSKFRRPAFRADHPSRRSSAKGGKCAPRPLCLTSLALIIACLANFLVIAHVKMMIDVIPFQISIAKHHLRSHQPNRPFFGPIPHPI